MQLKPLTIDGLVKWNAFVSLLLGALWLLSLVLALFLSSLAPTRELTDLGPYFHSNSPDVKALLGACINNEGVVSMAYLSSHVPIHVVTGLLFVPVGLSLSTLYFGVELRKQLRARGAT